jgi:hypothetical protein
VARLGYETLKVNRRPCVRQGPLTAFQYHIQPYRAPAFAGDDEREEQIMTKPKVLISDKMDPNAAKIFEERGRRRCHHRQDARATESRIGQYDGLAIRSFTKVTKEILDAATNLKVIGRAGIGVDNVDIPAASAKGVVVMNTPFGNSITTAEHAIAMMFALARQMPEANARRRPASGKEPLHGRRSDRQDARPDRRGQHRLDRRRRALGLKMKVVAFDPFLTPERASKWASKRSISTRCWRGRFHHAAHAADRPDAQHPVGETSPRPRRACASSTARAAA